MLYKEEVNKNAHNFVIVDEIQKVPELIDGIEILYYHTFCEKLWKGKLF